MGRGADDDRELGRVPTRPRATLRRRLHDPAARGHGTPARPRLRGRRPPPCRGGQPDAPRRRPQPGAAQARAALQQEIQRRSAGLDADQVSLDQLRAQVAQLQRQALSARGGDGLAQRAQLLGLLSAEVPVTGSGLKITMNDAASASTGAGGADPRATAGKGEDRVLDRDLQIVVNGLWAAGAEAIAVNGQRLTALSAIRSAGEAILVDFRPLSPPYVLRAVGDSATLQRRFTAGAAGRRL